MNSDIIKKFAGVERKKGECPICKSKIDVKDFRDVLSLKECVISGMCQKCQDNIFKEKEDEDDE